jgi:hypothetical protein
MKLLRLLHFIGFVLCCYTGHPVKGWSSADVSMSRRQAFLSVGGASSCCFVGFPAAWAAEEDDEEERRPKEEALRQRMLERRQLMEASRSSKNRQSYLDLSRQRAVLYNTSADSPDGSNLVKLNRRNDPCNAVLYQQHITALQRNKCALVGSSAIVYCNVGFSSALLSLRN